jgi:hypothetical protein
MKRRQFVMPSDVCKCGEDFSYRPGTAAKCGSIGLPSYALIAFITQALWKATPKGANSCKRGGRINSMTMHDPGHNSVHVSYIDKGSEEEKMHHRQCACTRKKKLGQSYKATSITWRNQQIACNN